MFRSLFVFALAAALCFSGAVQADDKGQFTSDQHFVNDAAIGGLAEVQLGKLAMDKGTTDAVKSLGQRLMRDHQQLNTQLQQVAGKSRLQVPAALDAKHQKMVQEFQQLSGARFDRKFLQDQVKDHEKDIAQFEAAAKSAKDPALRDFAERSLPTLREHLKMAQAALGQNTNLKGSQPAIKK